jgi:endogenous inhibitor of DNA gyrase (YacG/DUF329 family)
MDERCASFRRRVALIRLNILCGTLVIRIMKMFEVSCPSCGALYEAAESTSVRGNSGVAHCTICGNPLASRDESKSRVYRLVISPEQKYPRVSVPPSPLPESRSRDVKGEEPAPHDQPPDSWA